VASTKVIKEARGGADYTFTELQKLVIGEYETYMKTEKEKARDPQRAELSK
jgi:hypothetical protein